MFSLKSLEVPDKVVIGDRNYLVIPCDEPIIDKGEVCNGLIKYIDCEIDIDNHMNKQMQKHAFWHEVLHGIVHDRVIDFNNDDEETIIDQLATGLLALRLYKEDDNE